MLYLELPDECDGSIEGPEGDKIAKTCNDDRMVLLHSVLVEFVRCENSKA